MENLLQCQSITAISYTEDLRDDWEQFVEQRALNSTFLHSRRFFDHNPLNDLDDASLLFYQDKKIVAVLPAVLYLKNNRRILHSHLRATYGGFVVSNQVGLEEAVQIVEQTILFAKEKKVQQIIIRNPFRIFHSRLCDETDYAMWYYGFSVKSRELETAVSLFGNIEGIRAEYKKGTKRNVGRTKGVIEVKISDDFEAFWAILEKNLMERHGQVPVHDLEAIIKLRENVGKDKVLLFGAFYNSKLIAGNIVFNFNNAILHGQYSALDKDYQHLRPLYAVVDYVLEWGNKRGAHYYNLGMSNEDEGKKINLGLCNFKEGFGGRGVLRETMFLNLSQL